MMAAFMRAGFEAVDVTMTDLQEWRHNLSDFWSIAACGWFSYGDVLGAGRAWAQVILNNPELRSQFEAFFQRRNTFGIGVCNGNQMLSQLKEVIPWAEHWSTFSKNDDGPFKARYSPVTIGKSNSIFLTWMEWSVIPMVSAHGEGKASESEWAVMQYVDNHWAVTEQYPQNPNGSPSGATGFTTLDGRFTTMMPHPERTVRIAQCSWLPREYQNKEWDAPWMQGFYNLRVFAENNPAQ
jgi:phosphoribosylformylglycinamidine synthase